MCLMVYCNGMSEVKGKFVSIYLRSLYGKYDKGLNWPLRCKVDIEIESARKGLPNLKRTIEVRSQSPVPEDRCFSKGQEYGCYRRALCLSATIGYQNITSYLLTGCLTIKIAKVMIN